MPSIADSVRQVLRELVGEVDESVVQMADSWFKIIATIEDPDDREKGVRVVGAALAMQAARAGVKRADREDERLKEGLMGALRIGLLFL